MVWALGSRFITWEQEEAAFLETYCDWFKLRKVNTNDSGSSYLFWWSVFQGIGLVLGIPENLPWFLKFCHLFSWSDQYSVCLNSVPLNYLLVIEPLFQGISLVLGILANLPCFSEFCCSLSWTDKYPVGIVCPYIIYLFWTFYLKTQTLVSRLIIVLAWQGTSNHVQSVIDFLLYLSSNTMSLCTKIIYV